MEEIKDEINALMVQVSLMLAEQKATLAMILGIQKASLPPEEYERNLEHFLALLKEETQATLDFADKSGLLSGSSRIKQGVDLMERLRYLREHFS